MKFTRSWLQQYLTTNADNDTIAKTLTAIGLEVESVTPLGAGLESFTVARIEATEPHPNAEKLQVCRVATHTGERQIVCGAPNARAGMHVALADIGDVIPANRMVIKPAKIRGVESAGMLCSRDELGLGGDDQGIMELPPETLVGQKLIEALGLDDVLFDIAITPNRGDCLGVYGIARDLAAAGLGTLAPLLPAHIPDAGEGWPVALHTSDCPHFVAYTIKGVQNGESPEWLKARLRSVGLNPISALVDITNYFTIAYGRPLHVYDAAKLSGAIQVRHSQAGETLEALNDRDYTLPEGLCVIADDNGVLGLGGVIGGRPSGCDETTTDVVLEAAWFDPVAVARTGQHTMIDSDARHRFERQVDPSGTAPFAARAAAMITELCGGEITGVTQSGSAPDTATGIAYDPATLKTLCGVSVPAEEQRESLIALGCSVNHDWTVTPPPWRPDLTIPADICEEVLRLKGYDVLPEAPLPVSEILPVIHQLDDKARHPLLARGLDEAVHYAFTAANHASLFADEAELVQVANPISRELDVMRPHLFTQLLPAIQRNQDRGHTDLGLFELGTVFEGVAPEAQPLSAAAVRTGETPMHWQHRARGLDFYDMKADLIALLRALGVAVDAVTLSREVPGWYHPGKAARLSLGPKQVLGYVGELHPAILRHFDISTPVLGFECPLGRLPLKHKQKRPSAYRVSEYQTSRRDFAFVVDDDVPAGALRQAISKADKTLIRDVQLFDVYQGQHMERGKKSLAFAVTLQAKDRTLSEEDLSRVGEAVIAAANKQGAELR